MSGDAPPSDDSERFAEAIDIRRTFEHAIEHIVEGIDRDGLRTGDRLPNEGDLAEQLEISKPTLRQAIRVLERAGLVTARRGLGGGLFVAADLIPTDLIGTYVASEEHDLVEILIARRYLETAVTELAMAVGRPADYAAMERANGALESHLGERSQVMNADASFHRAVSRACHNRPLQIAMRGLARNMAPLRDAYGGGREYDVETLRIHRLQVEAMRDADAASLRGVLDEHFRMLEEALAAAMGRSWSDVFRPALGAFERPSAR